MSSSTPGQLDTLKIRTWGKQNTRCFCLSESRHTELGQLSVALILPLPELACAEFESAQSRAAAGTGQASDCYARQRLCSMQSLLVRFGPLAQPTRQAAADPSLQDRLLSCSAASTSCRQPLLEALHRQKVRCSRAARSRQRSRAAGQVHTLWRARSCAQAPQQPPD